MSRRVVLVALLSIGVLHGTPAHAEPEGPLVVGLLHSGGHAREKLRSSSRRIERFFATRANQGRLFIEGNAQQATGWSRGSTDLTRANLEPFEIAGASAAKKGWQVQGLDDAFKKTVADKSIETDPALRLHAYYNKNLRERKWAIKMRVRNAGAHDVIVMHPNHVAGFLAESGLSPKRVLWLDRPYANPHFARLTPDELAALKARRLSARRTRKPEAY